MPLADEMRRPTARWGGKNVLVGGWREGVGGGRGEDIGLEVLLAAAPCW